jgi:Leucine-rich repeat (LRR) protein
MNVTDLILSSIKLNKSDHTDSNTTIFLESKNIYNIFLKKQFESIEYLFLRKNQLKSIEFIDCLPNLFYLDVKENQVRFLLN